MTELPFCERTSIESIKKGRGYYHVVFSGREKEERGLVVSESSDIGKFIYENYMFLQKGVNVRLEIDPDTGTVSEIIIDRTLVNTIIAESES
jgi:hypothetical protein